MRYGWITKAAFAATAVAVGCYATLAQDNEKDAKPRITATTPSGDVAMRAKTSYMPVDATEPLASVKARTSKEKPAVMQQAAALLAERYDLSDRPSKDAKMSRVRRSRSVRSSLGHAATAVRESLRRGKVPSRLRVFP